MDEQHLESECLGIIMVGKDLQGLGVSLTTESIAEETLFTLQKHFLACNVELFCGSNITCKPFPVFS